MVDRAGATERGRLALDGCQVSLRGVLSHVSVLSNQAGVLAQSNVTRRKYHYSERQPKLLQTPDKIDVFGRWKQHLEYLRRLLVARD